jgi:uncharacterized membrane protein
MICFLEVIKVNKEKFLSELKEKLTVLSKEEREAALTYYEEYFNDAGIENEQIVLKELGSVDKVVEVILKENNYDVSKINKEDNDFEEDNNIQSVNYVNVALIVVLIVFVFPVIIPGLIGLFFAILGLFFAGIGILVAGCVVTFVGFGTMFTTPVNGLLVLGIGLIMFAIGNMLTSFMAIVFSKGIPSFIRLIVRICKWPFQKGGIKI